MNANALVQVVKKIPLLNGLSPSRVRAMLTMCEGRSVAAGRQLCAAGGISDEMYILLAGELGIFTAEGLQVAVIKPVNALGIGAITGQPRLAAVQALLPSKVLIIAKSRLDQFLREDKASCSRIYRNFIHILAGKVNNDNLRLRDFQLEKERLEGRLAVLQRQFKAQQQRTQVLLDFIAQKGGMDAAAARQQLDAQHPAARVLVVDSRPEFRQQFIQALPGLETAEADSGPQALEAVGAEQPDLVVTALGLPEMDGLALLQALRARNPSLPVVAVVGEGKEDSVEGKGFDGLASEPLQAEALRAVVGGLLEKEGVC